MSRRKQQPEEFNVAEFLRESDDDLKSALNSLLRSPVDGDTQSDSDNLTPQVNLEPPSNLIPEFKLRPGFKSSPASSKEAAEPSLKAPPGLTLTSGPNLVSNSIDSGPELVPGLNLTAASILIPVAPTTRRFPVRLMQAPDDAHTRAEQQVYEYLWNNAQPLDDKSRTITIGFGTMARLVRLSESNARINVRNLISKLAMEEHEAYNCERSIGRTYRIFDFPEILRKRREAGLLWYMRRTLAVVFVNPTTGERLNPKQSKITSTL